MVTLYELASSIKRLEEVVEDEKELATYLDGVEMQLVEKANNIIRYRQSLIAGAEAIDTEIKRLSDLKKSVSNKAKNIENYISYAMKKHNIEKIDADIAKISFRKSETLEVENEALIPEEFILTKEIKQVDKMAIKKAIKDGRKVDGVLIQVHQNLNIR